MAAVFFATFGCAQTGCCAQTDSPAFDCSEARSEVEKLICADNDLSALDRKLSDQYKAAMIKAPEDTAFAIKSAQRRWLRTRNACSKSDDMRACVQSTYQIRTVEIQIQELLTVPKAVVFDCDGADKSKPFFATFYGSTVPESAAFTYGKKQVIALQEPSGNGSKYGADGFEFWEHHGEAAVNWFGAQFNCKPLLGAPQAQIPTGWFERIRSRFASALPRPGSP